MDFLWVGLGSALGGMARYAVVLLSQAGGIPAFPWGTLAVNLAGSFLMGLGAALIAGGIPAGHPLQRFVLAGFLGGFTTFSAFSHDTLALGRQGEWMLACLNVLASVLACLAAVWLGARWGRSLAP